MINLSKEQKDAKNTIMDWVKSKNKTSYITLGGYAGTGKTSLISEVRKSLPKTWNVAFCAYTGKAAGVLRDKLTNADAIMLGDYVGTIHSLCYVPKKDYETGLVVFERKWRLPYQFIIVDEAAMITEDIFRDLRSYGVPMLFVGDHGQLPPISKDDFNLMSNPDVRLEEIHRFGSDSTLLDLSIMARNGEDIPFKVFDDKVAKVKESDLRVNDFISENLGDFSNGVCLCATNNTRVDVNQLIRVSLGVIDNINDIIPKSGDRVVCLRNNRHLVNPIYNGMLGRINTINEPKIEDVYSATIDVDDGFRYSGLINKSYFGKMKYDDGILSSKKEFITMRELYSLKSKLTIFEKKSLRKIGDKKLFFDSFDFGYCLTVHKAQGSEWGNVLLFQEESPYWDDEFRRRWLYTAVTRSSDRLLIIAP